MRSRAHTHTHAHMHAHSALMDTSDHIGTCVRMRLWMRALRVYACSVVCCYCTCFMCILMYACIYTQTYASSTSRSIYDIEVNFSPLASKFRHHKPTYFDKDRLKRYTIGKVIYFVTLRVGNTEWMSVYQLKGAGHD